ncbi:MAG: electron transfer flavoprotein subunit beta/FixA family protein [Clostridiaceae bacterium]|nr:electron transfer flavoprotein subunit beta/FixA family protein [Clostridiaceae bacterium]
MKIVVCVKQVPDTTEVKIDPVKGTLIRDGVPSILNPDDANALEAALTMKENNPGSTVSVITMGPPQADYMLRECLAMGADAAYLLSDRVFSGADTCATSATLAAGIRKLGGADIIITGRQAIDGDTAQVGPQVATRLGIPVISYVQKIYQEGDMVYAERKLEDGYERLAVKMPCLLTTVKELNTPRYMTIKGIIEAYEKEIIVWDHNDLCIEPEECGLSASPTKVLRTFVAAPKGKGEILSGTESEMAEALISKLREKHVL